MQGIQPKFKNVQARSLESMTLMDSQFFMVKVKDKEQEIEPTEEGEPAEVQEILRAYEAVFGEPTQLSPPDECLIIKFLFL